MQSNVETKHSLDTITRMRLLPAYFKKLGLLIMVMSFLPKVIVKIVGIDMAVTQYATLKYLSTNGIIFGMLLIAFAKDKVEHERTFSLRLQTLFFALAIAVSTVLLEPLKDFIIGDPVGDIKGQDVLFNMVAFYVCIYHLQKRAVESELSRGRDKTA